MPCNHISIAISTLLLLTIVILPTCGRKPSNQRANGPHRHGGDAHPISPILSSSPDAPSSFSIGDSPRDDDSVPLAFAAEPASQFVAFNNKKVTFRCSPKVKQARVTWLFNSNPLNESFFSPYLKISKSTRLNIQLPKIDATANDASGHSLDRVTPRDVHIVSHGSDSSHSESSLQKMARDIMDKLNGTIQCLITSPFSNDSLLSNPVKIFIATLEAFPSPTIDSSSDSASTNITQNVTYIEDNTAVITCNLPHSVPSAVAEYFFTPTSGGGSAANTILIDKNTDASKYLIMPSGNLQILNVKSSDSGIYECVAHNPFIDERKKSPILFNLRVKKRPSARLSHPKFTSHPNPMVSAISGTNLTLECAASSPSPGPRITWSKINGSLPHSRTRQVAGNLIIDFVNRSDEGTYVCKAEAASQDTRLPEVLEARSTVTIHETVSVSITKNIVKSSDTIGHHSGPGAIITCSARGNPRPNIYWVYNGLALNDAHDSGIYSFGDTSLDSADTSRVYIQKDKISSGLLQCFATNELGTVYESIKAWDSNDDLTNKNTERFSFNTFDEPVKSAGVHSSNRDALEVGSSAGSHHSGNSDEEIPDVDGIFASVPSTGRNTGRPNGGRSKRPNKNDSNGAKPIPSRPVVNRLSDDSVIVRWSIPEGSDKTQIDFFKVQYKDIEKDGSFWRTADDEILPHMHSYIINGLTPNANYKFRVSVAYKNNDNAQSPASHKFTLQKNPSITRPKAAPVITSVVPLSPSALEVTWQYQDLHMLQNSIDGFFIHYRETTSIAAYYTTHVEGAGTRSHILSHLLPATAYEVKIQAHNIAGPSADSNILSNSTLAKSDSSVPTMVTPSTETPPRSPTPGPAHDAFVVYLLLGIIVFISVLVIITFFTLCVVKQKKPNAVSANTSNSTLSIDSSHRHRQMGNSRSIDPHSLRGSPVNSLRRDKLKYGKERHPKAHSLHNLHHSMSKLDYSNPYGNYVKTATINKTAINGTLTKSMNGLAFHSESTNHSAFMYQDAHDSSDTEMSDKISEIRITVSPQYETESVQVDIGDRRNGLLTTATTTTTTTSSLSRGRNSPRVHGRNSTFRTLNRNASFKQHMASGHTLTHRHQHTHQYAMQHHTLDHRYTSHRSSDSERTNASNINFNANGLNTQSTMEGISPRSDFSRISSQSATANYDRRNRNQMACEKASSIISSLSTSKNKSNNHITNTSNNNSRCQYLSSYGESPLSSASEPGSSASSTSANVTSGGASSDNCCEGDSGTPLLMNRCSTTHNSSTNGPLVIMQSSC